MAPLSQQNPDVLLVKRMDPLLREQLSFVLGFKIDPLGPADTATIAAGSVFFALTLSMLIYAWVHRDYPPIRAKNIRVMTLMYIGALFWFIGDIPINGHVELVGVWSVCKLWSLWVRLFFAYTFSASAAIRTYAIYRIFILRKPYSGFKFYIPMFILFGCLIVYCTVSTLVSNKLTAIYREELHFCTYVWAFRGACLALLWCIWFVVLFFVFKIRNVHSSFNERYESIIVCLLAFTAVANTTFLHILKPNYPLQMHLRVSNTWIDFLVSNGAVWSILIYPVVQCMFNRQEYLKSWTAKLRADGLGREYNVSPSNTHGTNPPLQYSKMNNSETGNSDTKVLCPPSAKLTEDGPGIDDSYIVPMTSYEPAPYK
ncbi:hypothetical protein GGI12_002016 [Dipsacomyces acuminosporus]|nr:hypothetical protein GGI12_002016 [Dipsacomyces acuminosporus]